MFALIGTPLLWSAGSGETREQEGGTPSAQLRPEVTYLEGYVRINGEEARLGQTVPIDSKVRTGAESYCSIRFGNKNIFRIEPRTLTRISISKDDSKIDITRGSIDAVFDRLKSLSGREDFRISTPSAIAGVRGTVFYIKVEDPQTTYVCTCHGTLHQHVADEPPESGREVTSYHHKAYRYIRTEEETRVEDASLEYHDDEAMDGIAEQIGVEIPWGRAE
jgi:hypothetical protein